MAALEEGVLKVMSKMGISDVASYRGARLFEAVGLDRTLCRDYLGGTPSAIGGARLDRFEREALDRLEPLACDPGRSSRTRATTSSGRVASPMRPTRTSSPRCRRPSPARTPCARRRATAAPICTTASSTLVNGRAPLEPRDLLELVPAGPPVPLEEVEPAEAIVRRFSSGAMSHGALSAEAHETIAIALNGLGARSNSGEGGENPERFRDERNSKIKQVASGRFGVTAEYAVFAEELQIKIAQGSKPGEGGRSRRTR